MSRPSLSTGTGDGGDTGLIGRRRVSKAHERIQAYGTVDELNAVIGVVLAEQFLGPLKEQLLAVQRMLFTVGSDLAAPPETGDSVPRVTPAHVEQVEVWAAALEADLPALGWFILPSGSRAGSLLHLARTVCRRAERWVVALAAIEDVSPHVRVYLNRLSDYLFLAARAANRAAGAGEERV